MRLSHIPENCLTNRADWRRTVVAKGAILTDLSDGFPAVQQTQRKAAFVLLWWLSPAPMG
jgi:hypothetical protein